MKMKTYEKPRKQTSISGVAFVCLFFPILVSSVICYSSVVLCLNGICMCMQIITHTQTQL